ncbi:hypothetical protein PQX77_010239 [Marasmius sp. AFHP31]|nr:hypothetical protein PQX77_010239 [Marasmius sp. AFHP31]
MADPRVVYTLPVGKESYTAEFKDLLVTPTRTIYVLNAGVVHLNITFLSPIEPDDIIRQSFPFGYVFVDVASSDGAAHRVQVYSDLTGEWLSTASNVQIEWSTSTSPGILTHFANLSLINRLQEFNEMCQDAVFYHATDPRGVSGVTWQTEWADTLRSGFLTHGYLKNTKDTRFRNIDDKFPAFAFSHDLGQVTSTQSVVYAVGLARDPVIKLVSEFGSSELRPYWSTRYNSVDEELQVFLADAIDAKARAIKLDNRIQTEALKISPFYRDLVSVATRQTLAAVETVVGPSPGSIYMFMKDVGSSTRVSPVETLYAAFPAFLYINSTWCQYLLEPLLQYQSSSQYTKFYAAPDLGMSLIDHTLSGH